MNLRLILVLLLAQIQLTSGMNIKSTESFQNVNNFNIFVNGQRVYTRTNKDEIKTGTPLDQLIGSPMGKPLTNLIQDIDLGAFKRCGGLHIHSACNNISNTTSNIAIDSISVNGKAYTHYHGSTEKEGKIEYFNYYIDSTGKKFTANQFKKVTQGTLISHLSPYEIKEDQNDLAHLTANLNSLSSKR